MIKFNLKLVIVILVVAFVIIFFGGKGVLFSPAVSVTRSISVLNSEVHVSLQIVSDKKLIAIEEVLPEGSEIVDYSINQDYEIFTYKEDGAWVIADSDKVINAELLYVVNVPIGQEISGVYYSFDEEDVIQIIEIEGDFVVEIERYPYDVNEDGFINILDMIAVRNFLNADVSVGDYWRADVNEDGFINILDMIAVRNHFNEALGDDGVWKSPEVKDELWKILVAFGVLGLVVFLVWWKRR